MVKKLTHVRMLILGFIFLTIKTSYASDIISYDLPSLIASIPKLGISEITASYTGDLGDEIFLRKAFDRAIKDANIEQPDDYKACFYPSKGVISNYNHQSYHDGKQKACKYELKCKHMRKCKYKHFLYGAFHSTDQNNVKAIFENGFKASESGCSMGAGVYFTISMNKNNKDAYEKSHSYGQVVIITLVIPHEGIHEIKKDEIWKKSGQDWLSGGADIKFMREGVKCNWTDDKEYAGENVIRDAEKIIPLGIIYPADMKNPLDQK